MAVFFVEKRKNVTFAHLMPSENSAKAFPCRLLRCKMLNLM